MFLLLSSLDFNKICSKSGLLFFGILYDLKYSVSGSIVFDDGSISIYYKINNQWYRDSFDKTGVFTSKQKYNLSLVLKDEVDYNIDLNEDGYIGDVIAAK